MYVGGFIDLQSKRPYFDKFKGTVSATVGSYSMKRWTVDVGGPMSETSAYRFSYSGEDTDGYYVNGFKKTHSLYGALQFRPSANYDLFLNGQFFYANYTENWGINRVTQALIDNGLYTRPASTSTTPRARPSDAQNSVNGPRRRQHHRVGPHRANQPSPAPLETG